MPYRLKRAMKLAVTAVVDAARWAKAYAGIWTAPDSCSMEGSSMAKRPASICVECRNKAANSLGTMPLLLLQLVQVRRTVLTALISRSRLSRTACCLHRMSS